MIDGLKVFVIFMLKKANRRMLRLYLPIHKFYGFVYGGVPIHLFALGAKKGILLSLVYLLLLLINL